MTIKSPIQPLCPCCARPLRKDLEWIEVFQEPPRTTTTHEAYHFGLDGQRRITTREIPLHVPKHVLGSPRTIEEAQKLVNMKVLQIRRLKTGIICKLGMWDGETYGDSKAPFCSGDCAQLYGRWAFEKLGTQLIRKDKPARRAS